MAIGVQRKIVSKAKFGRGPQAKAYGHSQDQEQHVFRCTVPNASISLSREGTASPSVRGVRETVPTHRSIEHSDSILNL